MMLKYSICVLFCLVAIAIAQDDPKREERIFNQWLKKHNLDVKETDDLGQWKKDVIAKFKDAEAHNAKFRKGEVKFKKAINHLSHLTPEQRNAQLYGFELNPQKPTNEKFVPQVDPSLLKDFPDYWNWADHGAVFPPQDQKACSSCYIFGAIGAIEGHSCLYTNTCEKLSEQEGLDCSPNLCGPGKPEIVYNYTQDASGAAFNKDYKYVGSPSKCEPSKLPRVPGTKVLDWKWMPNHAETIRYYLKTVGPMTMSIEAYPNLSSYQGGVYDDIGEGKPGGHLILLVGYGTETDGTPYWILKNSWTEKWGENGFFRMKRGVNLCKCESQWPGYPILDGT